MRVALGGSYAFSKRHPSLAELSILCTLLARHPAATSFDWSINRLPAEAGPLLARILAAPHSEVARFVVRYNSLAAGASALAAPLVTNTALLHLDMRNCAIPGGAMVELLLAISQNATLLRVYLSNNLASELRDGGNAAAAAAAGGTLGAATRVVENHPTLLELDLCRTNAGRHAPVAVVRQLGAALARNTTLHLLRLAGNRIPLRSCFELGRAIAMEYVTDIVAAVGGPATSAGTFLDLTMGGRRVALPSAVALHAFPLPLCSVLNVHIVMLADVVVHGRDLAFIAGMLTSTALPVQLLDVGTNMVSPAVAACFRRMLHQNRQLEAVCVINTPERGALQLLRGLQGNRKLAALRVGTANPRVALGIEAGLAANANFASTWRVDGGIYEGTRLYINGDALVVSDGAVGARVDDFELSGMYRVANRAQDRTLRRCTGLLAVLCAAFSAMALMCAAAATVAAVQHEGGAGYTTLLLNAALWWVVVVGNRVLSACVLWKHASSGRQPWLVCSRVCGCAVWQQVSTWQPWCRHRQRAAEGHSVYVHRVDVRTDVPVLGRHGVDVVAGVWLACEALPCLVLALVQLLWHARECNTDAPACFDQQGVWLSAHHHLRLAIAILGAVLAPAMLTRDDFAAVAAAETKKHFYDTQAARSSDADASGAATTAAGPHGHTSDRTGAVATPHAPSTGDTRGSRDEDTSTPLAGGGSAAVRPAHISRATRVAMFVFRLVEVVTRVGSVAWAITTDRWIVGFAVAWWWVLVTSAVVSWRSFGVMTRSCRRDCSHKLRRMRSLCSCGCCRSPQQRDSDTVRALAEAYVERYHSSRQVQGSLRLEPLARVALAVPTAHSDSDSDPDSGFDDSGGEDTRACPAYLHTFPPFHPEHVDIDPATATWLPEQPTTCGASWSLAALGVLRQAGLICLCFMFVPGFSATPFAWWRRSTRYAGHLVEWNVLGVIPVQVCHECLMWTYLIRTWVMEEGPPTNLIPGLNAVHTTATVATILFLRLVSVVVWYNLTGEVNRQVGGAGHGTLAPLRFMADRANQTSRHLNRVLNARIARMAASRARHEDSSTDSEERELLSQTMQFYMDAFRASDDASRQTEAHEVATRFERRQQQLLHTTTEDQQDGGSGKEDEGGSSEEASDVHDDSAPSHRKLATERTALPLAAAAHINQLETDGEQAPGQSRRSSGSDACDSVGDYKQEHVAAGSTLDSGIAAADRSFASGHLSVAESVGDSKLDVDRNGPALDHDWDDYWNQPDEGVWSDAYEGDTTYTTGHGMESGYTIEVAESHLSGELPQLDYLPSSHEAAEENGALRAKPSVPAMTGQWEWSAVAQDWIWHGVWADAQAQEWPQDDGDWHEHEADSWWQGGGTDGDEVAWADDGTDSSAVAAGADNTGFGAVDDS